MDVGVEIDTRRQQVKEGKSVCWEVMFESLPKPDKVQRLVMLLSQEPWIY